MVLLLLVVILLVLRVVAAVCGGGGGGGCAHRLQTQSPSSLAVRPCCRPKMPRGKVRPLAPGQQSLTVALRPKRRKAESLAPSSAEPQKQQQTSMSPSTTAVASSLSDGKEDLSRSDGKEDLTELEEIDIEWHCFEKETWSMTPPVRLDASKYLAEGVYRKIRAAYGTCVYILVAEIPPGVSILTQEQLESSVPLGTPKEEIEVSYGKLVLWDDEIVIYDGEPVKKKRRCGPAQCCCCNGVLVCGSRAGLGSSTKPLFGPAIRSGKSRFGST